MSENVKKVRRCKYCGDPFYPNSNAQKYCKARHYRVCPVCKNFYFEDNLSNLSKPERGCSYKCRAILRREKSLKENGVSEPGNTPQAREKAKQTLKDKYGATGSNDSVIQVHKLLSEYTNLKFNKCELSLYDADIRRIEFNDNSSSIKLSECVMEDHVTVCEFSRDKYQYVDGVVCEVLKYYDINSVYNLINAFLSIYSIDYVYLVCEIDDKLIELPKNLNLQPTNVYKSKLIFKISKF